jgi:hypothetical protein
MSLIFFNTETFCYGDVMFRRRCVTGDVMLWRRSVKETFSMETFCRGDVSCGDVLYVHRRKDQTLAKGNRCVQNFFVVAQTIFSYFPPTASKSRRYKTMFNVENMVRALPIPGF